MRITLVNGEPDPGSLFQSYLDTLATHLVSAGHAVTELVLRDLHLKGCAGCWGCWVKTPGQCAKGDDSALLCRGALDSDLLVLASPVHMGFTSALLKGAVDQMIPLLHPYFVMEGGEVHHRPRYGRYPRLAVLLDPRPGTDAEDLAITEALWRRFGRNFKAPSVLTAVTGRTPLEVAHGFTAA